MTSPLADRIVLITGASSGIGAAAARLLAAAGATVVLGARRRDRLDALVAEITAAGGTARAHTLDVTRRDDVQAFVDAATADFGRVDVIVNNAGVMPLSALSAGKVDEWDRMVDVNIKGVLYGIAAALPGMRARGSGHVINVASTGGHAVSPTAAVYCATKYAVRAISEGLRQEEDRVRVTIISPGVTESELADSITDPAARDGMQTYRRTVIGADAVARAIRFAIEQPEDVDTSEIIIRPTAVAW
ncbi:MULTISPECIES: SDR family oxidoreductase [Luteimonas]|uniref:SDR family oxidoreductase n=1 Tax=Luteimonas TaxID=83614 RepID=UPI000C7CA91E|nr:MULTISPECIES: SDR family oxidoreductase [Luteimonas]